MEEQKVILDPCCGSRMMWFDRDHHLTMYGDKRKENHVLCDGRKLNIEPDIVMDFTCMPFPDNSFKHVVFDPPHMTSLGATSWMAKKYGRLGEVWEAEIKKGFDECIRVLETYGTLVFKWNEHDVKIKHLISILGQQPLYGHTTGRQAKTIWMCFMKEPTGKP